MGTALTLWALVGDDLRIMLTEKPHDIVFSMIALCAMAVFLFEVVNQTLADPDYFGSFFFYLDCVSTVSMLFDIHWTKPVLEDAVRSWTNADTKSSKTARLGAKAGRVIRLLRLIRLLK